MSKLTISAVAAIFAGIQGLACAHHPDARPPARHIAPSHDPAATPPPGEVQAGLATWYGKELAGHKTTNGERFDPGAMTAAHRHLAFGTWVEVRRPETGAAVRVRINDRGPWGDDRKIIDLSEAAAARLGIVRLGVAHVELRVVGGPE